jgi:hypothetical protein
MMKDHCGVTIFQSLAHIRQGCFEDKGQRRKGFNILVMTLSCLIWMQATEKLCFRGSCILEYCDEEGAFKHSMINNSWY